ncbi:MAG: glycosyltransferase [Planctomycetota bacterium]
MQLEPLLRSRSQLRRAGLDIAASESMVASADVVAIQFDWALSLEEVRKRLAELRERMQPAAKLVVLDYVDSSTSQHLPAITDCDAFIKSQIQVDFADAFAVSGTAGMHQHRLQIATGFDAAEEHTRLRVESGLLDTARQRLRLGWNFAAATFVRRSILMSRFQRLFAPRLTPPSSTSRDIDVQVICTVGSLSADDWYCRHRLAAIAAVYELPSNIRRLAFGISKEASDGDRLVRKSGLSPRRFRATCRRTKIVVSPFGYGEICYRDLEAIAAGCVLVKPTMEHVRSKPDLYEPGVTYLPCRLDFADLPTVISRALADPESMDAVAATARKRLVDYHVSANWVQTFAEIVSGLDRGNTD